MPRSRLFSAGVWIAAVLALAMPAALGAAEAAGKMELGRKVFTQLAQPPCGLCHTLADAGTRGEIGVKLDDVKPDEERVIAAVRQGSGVMPRYEDKLTKEQIEAVAHYVAQSTQRSTK